MGFLLIFFYFWINFRYFRKFSVRRLQRAAKRVSFQNKILGKKVWKILPSLTRCHFLKLQMEIARYSQRYRSRFGAKI